MYSYLLFSRLNGLTLLSILREVPIKPEKILDNMTHKSRKIDIILQINKFCRKFSYSFKLINNNSIINNKIHFLNFITKNHNINTI